MANTATAGAPPPLHCGIPEEITIWEILVRLPPKALLRCRAVGCAWRRATSTRDFLLAHHAHQPSLPLVYDDSMYTMPYRAGLVSVDQSQFIARLGSVDVPCLASCDGLLVIFIPGKHFFIRNPATRQSANLPLLHGFRPLGVYRHSPTSEYRLLLYRSCRWMYGPLPPDVQEGSYVFAIGSGQPPRHIGWPDAEKLICTAGPVMFSGSLHWYTYRVIMIFDNTTESFQQMCSPFVPGHAQLFEMDNMLGMSIFSDERTRVDIWVVQDYDGGDWALKYRVELPVAEIRVQFGMFEIKYWHVRVVSCDGDVLVLPKFDDWLLQVDINGELVTGFHHGDLILTQVRLKQTLVLHTFFLTLAG